MFVAHLKILFSHLFHVSRPYLSLTSPFTEFPVHKKCLCLCPKGYLRFMADHLKKCFGLCPKGYLRFLLKSEMSLFLFCCTILWHLRAFAAVPCFYSSKIKIAVKRMNKLVEQILSRIQVIYSVYSVSEGLQ